MKKSAGTARAKQKSFADELDERVAKRTAELTAINEQLKRELVQHKQVAEALREGELNFNLIVESIPAPVAVTSPTGEVEAVNKPTLDYFGRTFEELKSWKSSDVVHPDDLQRTIAAQLEAHKTGSAYNVESRHRRADGVYRWFNVLGLPLRDGQGHIRHWFHLQIDIDDRKRAEAQLAGEKRLLEMVASRDALTDVLSELCRFVEETAADCWCGIYLIDWRTSTFHLGAAPSLPATFNDPVEALTVTSDAGPCGLAALNKTQVLVTDLESDPRFQSATIRPLELAHGIRSHWSTPIFSRNEDVLGTFAIFQSHPSSPTQFQLDLISQVTHIASIAIERASSEEALQSSERNLSLTINTIPTFIQVSRSDGSILSVNKAVLDYHGVTLQDVQKEDFRSRFYHPDDAERLCEKRKEALKRPLQFEYEQRALGKDGKYRWFLVRYNPLLDDRGQIDRWYATAFDIEDRKRAEREREQSQEALRNALAEIRKSESKLRQVIDAIPALAWCNLPDGPNEFLNKGWHEYTGLSPEQSHGWGWQAAFHPEDLPSLMDKWMKMLVSGEPDEIEARLRRHDGVYRWFLIRAEPFRDESNNIVRWYGTSTDIDDRKRAEALLASEMRLLEMVASGCSLPDVLDRLCRFVEDMAKPCYCGIYLIDPSGTKFQNAAAPSLPRSFNEPIEGASVDTETGPCGMAACLKTQVIASDVASDTRWPTSVFQPLALAHGLRSCSSTPILSLAGQVLGTFAIYKNERATPTPLQQELIARFTHIASIAIERALNEEALKRREMQFKTIFDEAGAGIALVDLQRQAPIQNNRALQKMLECTEEELGNPQTFDNLTHEDEREADAATYRELCAGIRDSLRLEKHFVLKDGRSIWVNVIFSLLRDEDGRPRYIIAIHEDITETKLVLERLQEYRELLDLAQKSAGAMAFDWYPQKEINYWSAEQEALFGLAPGTFDGTYSTWKRMTYAPDWPTVVEALDHARKTGKVSAEYRVVWPDGSLHWLSTNGRMFLDNAGKPLRMVGFTADVTRRKNVEEELRRSEEFLAQAQQLSRTGSFSWRVLKDEITWSEELYRIYQFDPGIKITFELIRKRVHPEDLTLYEKMVEQARNGADDFEWQYRLLMPDQSTKYMLAVARATRDQAGQLEYIAAVRDVTARQLADEALDKARLELAHVARVMTLGALTASIAHEVNQPLSGIITNASTCVRMLDADPPNVDGARATAKRTIRDGRRAADVITRLRALFSKKEAAVELVDLNEATQEVIALSRSELDRNSVLAVTALAEELPLVTGDRVQLQQVILNLLRNGAEAMSTVDDRPRELIFRTEVDADKWVRVSVQDAGIGFEPQAVNRLFQSFYTTKEHGMGIGLSVSRSIIENHRGRLWATPNDGPGVTFSFSIPCVDDAGESRSKKDDHINEQ